MAFPALILDKFRSPVLCIVQKWKGKDIKLNCMLLWKSSARYICKTNVWGFRGGDVEECLLLVAGIQHQGAGAYSGMAQCYLIMEVLQPSTSVKHRIQDDKESKLSLFCMGANVILCLERKTKTTNFIFGRASDLCVYITNYLRFITMFLSF